MEEQPHFFNGESKTSYSPVVFGFYINEIVRRVDPQKRTIDQFVRDEINKPLGTEFYFTVDRDIFENRLATMYLYPLIKSLYYTFQALVVNPLRGMLGLYVYPEYERFRGFVDKTNLINKCINNFDKEFVIEGLNSYETATLLSPGTSLKTNAYSISKLAALIANGGEIDGVRLLKKETVDQSLIEQESQFDHLSKKYIIRTLGGHGKLDKSLNPHLRGDTLSFGWAGFGGSLFSFNKEKHFSFSYVLNGMCSPLDTWDPVSSSLLSSFYELIQNDK